MTGAPDQREPLGIVFLGTPDAAVPTLRAARDAGFRVPLVVTRPDRRRGRGGGRSASPVKAAAEALSLEVFQPEDVNAEESLARIAAAAPDVLLIVAFGRILKKPLLHVARLLPLNLHFSLLPEYRGAAPVARAIADGRTETGITLQRVVRRLDAGPVLARRHVSIGPEETARELTERLAELGAAFTVETLRALAGGPLPEEPQDDERATLAPMLGKAEGWIDWSRPASELHAHVRAMDPWPGAFADFRGSARKKPIRVAVVRCRRGSDRPGGESPGEILRTDRDGIAVRTGDGELDLLELRPAGKKVLTAREFVNGYRAAPGDCFQASSESTSS